MKPNSTDSEIISEVLMGNREAFALLIHRYQTYIFTFCLRFLKNREDAEEVAQDVFIKAFKHLNGFRGDAKFSTWLYTIANSTCISFVRKKRTIVYSLDSEPVLFAAEKNNLSANTTIAEQKSTAAMMNAAVEMLNPDDAIIITLFYKAEQTLDEIAKVLNIETNAAKVRLHRARTRLKEKMQLHFSEEVKNFYS